MDPEVQVVLQMVILQYFQQLHLLLEEVGIKTYLQIQLILEDQVEVIKLQEVLGVQVIHLLLVLLKEIMVELELVEVDVLLVVVEVEQLQLEQMLHPEVKELLEMVEQELQQVLMDHLLHMPVAVVVAVMQEHQALLVAVEELVVVEMDLVVVQVLEELQELQIQAVAVVQLVFNQHIIQEQVADLV